MLSWNELTEQALKKIEGQQVATAEVVEDSNGNPKILLHFDDGVLVLEGVPDPTIGGAFVTAEWTKA